MPSARRGHANCVLLGDTFVVFGGSTSSGYLNDMYFYNMISNSWKQISTIHSPPARAYACIAFIFPNLYLYGGENDNGPLGDFWIFSFQTEDFTQIVNQGTVPPALSQAQCNVDADYFYLFGGKDSTNLSPGIFYIYLRASQYWSTIAGGNLVQVSSCGTVYMTSNLVQIGGKRINTAYSFVSSFSYSDSITTTLGYLPTPVSNHAIAYTGRSIYVFGGVDVISDIVLSDIGTSNFYKVTDPSFDCSTGYYGENCTMCEPGFYNPSLNAEECIACEAGSINNEYAAGYISQCIPCKVNTFSDINGGTRCKDCSVDEYCPVGTAVPNDSAETYDFTRQPSAYDEQQSTANTFTVLMMELMFGIAGIIGITFCFAYRSRIFLTIDIYKDLHPRKYYEDPFPTPLGGLFSLMFMIIAIFFILNPTVLYYISNISETKALVPSIIYDDIDITAASINMTFVLHDFNGICGINNTCQDNLFYQHASATTKGSLKGPYCYSVRQMCIIQFEISNASIDTFVSFNISMVSELVYTSQIDITVSATSSIPDAISATTLSVQAPDTQVLNGLSQSVFSFFLIPSVSSM